MMKVGALIFLALAPLIAHAETPDAVIRRAGLAGEVLISRGDRILLHRSYGTVSPGGGSKHRIGELWRMASITKQIAAATLLREISLSSLDSAVRPGWPTLRQLLTHHSGLANPDDTPTDGTIVPSFYTRASPDLGYCANQTGQPGSAFKYNNCDYLMLRPASVRWRWPAGMVMAETGKVGVRGFIKGKPEPAFNLATWGAAGGLVGNARSLLAFDRALMSGKFLPPDKLAELWKPEGSGSYQALGQWVFTGPLKGCTKAKRIVQRDGEILGVQTRNYILPDDDLVVIVFTNRSADDFDIGEIWQQSGFAYDLLSAVAC